MNGANAGIIAGIIVVIAFGAWAFGRKAEAPAAQVAGEREETQDATGAAGGPVSLGMYAEENAIVSSDQRPGGTVRVNRVLIAQSGYVVAHEDEAGKPGAIIGSSRYHDAGEHTGVEVRLTRPAKDGERLFLMIHAEKNGDMSFQPENDIAVSGSLLPGPIMAEMLIRTDADTDIEVMP